MSKYTFEVRRLCQTFGRNEVESWFKSYDLTEFLTDEQISVIENSPWNKDTLAKRIVDHYYMRESGAETPGLFRQRAMSIMNEIMEEKLPLIYSTAIQYNVLDANDYTETLTRTTSASSNSTTSTDGSGLTVNSDTPQGEISKSAILGGSYASSTRATENETSGSDNSQASGSENYTRSIKGRSGANSPAKLIQEYRKAIVAINRDIIKELDILFMGIF